MAASNANQLAPPTSATPSSEGKCKTKVTRPTSMSLAAYAALLAMSEAASKKNRASARVAESALSPPSHDAAAQPKQSDTFSPSSS
jgi:hypothetical protein